MSQTRVKLPDGTYVHVATDDPKQAAAAAKRFWNNKQKVASQKAPAPATSQASEDPSLWDRYKQLTNDAADFAGNMWDNITPNWMDEMYAAPRAAAAFVKGEDAGEAFRNAQREYKDNQRAFSKNHPTAKNVSTATGIAAGMALPASKALKGASMAEKAIQGAKVGAIYGGLAGAGEGEGLDLSNRGRNAAVGATVGGTMGAALPYAGDRAGAAGRWAREHVPGVDGAVRAAGNVADRVVGAVNERLPAPVQQAHRILGDRMTDGHMAEGPAHVSPQATPQRIAEEVQRRNEMGVPAMVGDVTQPMRDLTSWSSRGMGPGQTLVREALDRRKAREALRVRQHVSETMPTTHDPLRYVEQVRQDAKEAAGPLYEQAYAQPMYRTPPIQAIEQTPAFRKAVPQAYENIRNQIDPATGAPKSPEAMGFRYFDGDPNGLAPNVPYFALPEKGYVALDNGLSTEGYDQVVRAMSDQGKAASMINPVTGKIESTTNSVHINNRARDLRSQLMEQNSPYQQAVSGYGDDMAMTDAFNNGLDVGKLTGHEINAQRRAMPEFAQGPWTTGAGTAMADEASRFGARYPNGDTANHVRKMLGDETKQDALSQMSGNTGGLRQLQDRLEYEHQGNLNWRGVNGNSRTAFNQALDEDLNTAASGIPLSIGAVRDKMLNFIVSRMAPRYRNRVKDEIARVLTASDAQTVQEAMQAIERRAQQDEAFADLLHKAGIGAAAVAGMHSAPPEENNRQP